MFSLFAAGLNGAMERMGELNPFRLALHLRRKGCHRKTPGRKGRLDVLGPRSTIARRQGRRVATLQVLDQSLLDCSGIALVPEDLATRYAGTLVWPCCSEGAAYRSISSFCISLHPKPYPLAISPPPVPSTLPNSL